MLVLVFNDFEFELTAVPGARQSFCLHEPAHGAVGDGNPFTSQLLTDLRRDVDVVVVGLVHAQDLERDGLVA